MHVFRALVMVPASSTVYTTSTQMPAVDTCHFSATCNMETVYLWVHWREEESEGVHHYIECIKKAFYKPVQHDDSMQLLVAFRKALRNILDYAMNERLTQIKSALAKWHESDKAAQGTRTQKSSSQRSSQPATSRRTSSRKSSSTNLRRKSRLDTPQSERLNGLKPS
jgi:ERCC4-related helicase